MDKHFSPRFLERIFFSITGLCLISLGVALMTRTDLGCTPIAAIPYSLSLIVPPLSYGAWVALFNLCLLVCEWLLMRRKLPASTIAIQCALVFGFGLFVDIFMGLTENLIPGAYWGRILGVVAGSCSLAAGVAMSVIANLAVLPGDGLALAISFRSGKEFSRIRIYSDSLMALTALLMCLVVFHASLAVREGTIMAAILTGIFVKLFNALYARISHRHG